MLKQRILTALFLIPVFLCLLFYLPPLYFCIFTGLLMLVGAYEWTSFLRIEKIPYRLAYVAFFAILCVLSLFISILWMVGASVLFWMIASILLCMQIKKNELWSFHPILGGVFGVLVLLPCWSAINFLRNIRGDHVFIVYLFLLIWSADIAAFFVGKKWGVLKCAPLISPGKSWQGVFAAILSAFFISMIAAGYFGNYFSIGFYLIPVSVLTVIFSVIGDLFESMMKRSVNLKDSGKILPGHGGLLDRIDSLTAAAPIFIFLFLMASIFLHGLP